MNKLINKKNFIAVLLGLLLFTSNFVHAIDIPIPITNEDCRTVMVEIANAVGEATDFIKKSANIVPRSNLDQTQIEEGSEYVDQAIKCYDKAIDITLDMQDAISSTGDYKNNLHKESWSKVAQQTRKILTEVRRQWESYARNIGR